MNDDPYTRLAGAFRDKHELTADDIDAQWNVVQEEIDEMLDAFTERHATEAAAMFGAGDAPTEEATEDLAEEMADVLFTIHLTARMLGIDLRSAYIEKAKKNLEKSTERDENGKITDDAEV